MSQLYHVADTLGITMKVAGDTIWGFDTKIVNLGPIQAKLPISVFSDLIHSKDTGIFVKFSNTLWFYLVMRGTDEQVIYVFNAEEVGLTEKNSASFGSISINSTLLKISDSITAVFKLKEDSWTLLSAQEQVDYIPQ